MQYFVAFSCKKRKQISFFSSQPLDGGYAKNIYLSVQTRCTPPNSAHLICTCFALMLNEVNLSVLHTGAINYTCALGVLMAF